MHITGVAPAGRRKMPGILLRHAVGKTGLMRTIVLLLGSLDESRRLARENPDAMELCRSYSPEAARDFPMMYGMYRVLISGCINCEIARAFGEPDLARLGCDHDIAGYPMIEDEVNAVFRRSRTIAKGGEFCEFVFYRKGTEPEGPFENK